MDETAEELPGIIPEDVGTMMDEWAAMMRRQVGVLGVQEERGRVEVGEEGGDALWTVYVCRLTMPAGLAIPGFPPIRGSGVAFFVAPLDFPVRALPVTFPPGTIGNLTAPAGALLAGGSWAAFSVVVVPVDSAVKGALQLIEGGARA